MQVSADAVHGVDRTRAGDSAVSSALAARHGPVGRYRRHQRLEATFAVLDGYDVEVHGPNGFFRRFAAGTAAPGIEVSAHRPGDSETIQVVVTNDGALVDVTISGAYGNARPVTKPIRAGGRVEYVVSGDTHGWYGVTVTSSVDEHFVRGLAGHVENGRSSISDPALGR